MANTTQYKYSPRIFGKTGDQYLAMQPTGGMGNANYMSPPEDTLAYDYRNGNPPDPTGGDLSNTGFMNDTGTAQPIGVPTTEFEDVQNARRRLDVAIKSVPNYYHPQQFAGTLPHPQTLPPPATYNTDPAVNTLLKLYPWLSLFGGVRGASAVTTGAAEGIGIHAQNEDQRLAQQRAYQQQALDTTYQRDVKNQELQAESNRYYNSATGQYNTALGGEHKLAVGGAQGEYNRAVSVLGSARRTTTQQIASLLDFIKSRPMSWQAVQPYIAQLDNLRSHLRDNLGGPSVVTGIEGGLTADQAGWVDRLTELNKKQENAMTHLNRWGEIENELLTGKITGQKDLQQAEFTFKAKQNALNRQLQEKDINWHYYGIDAGIYKTDVERQGQLQALDSKLRTAAITQDQKTALTAYEKATTRFLQAQAQFNVLTAKLDSFYKVAAGQGKNYVPDPNQVAQMQGYEAQLPGLQQEMREAGKDAKQYRELIALPAEQVPLPGAGLQPVRPISPQLPNNRGGDNGNRNEHGAGARGGGQPGGRASAATHKRSEKPGSSPPAKPTVETPQQRRDRLINRYAPK